MIVRRLLLGGACAVLLSACAHSEQAGGYGKAEPSGFLKDYSKLHAAEDETEATLSYLGIGLPATSVSWGIDISAGQNLLRSGNPILLYPAVGLALTVLSFMMMGDALRDALDPKARTR